MNVRSLKHWLRKIKNFNRPALDRNPLSLISAPEGFKFWNKKNELTARVGLGVSWLSNGTWKDCSAFKSKALLWNPNRLQIEKTDSKVPFRLLFNLQFQGPLALNLELTVVPDAVVEKLKITFFLHTQYKNWVAGLQEGSFPRYGAWVSVGLSDPQCKFIGAYSYFPDYLPLIFEFENATHKIENSDAQTGARILCAEFPELNSNTVYRGQISFFENATSFWTYLKKSR